MFQLSKLLTGWLNFDAKSAVVWLIVNTMTNFSQKLVNLSMQFVAVDRTIYNSFYQ